jgi:hypothetical protein
VHTPVTEVCATTAVVWLRLVDDVRSTASDVVILAIALIGMCVLILSPRTEREIDAQPRHTPGRQQRASAAAAGRCCGSLACMSIDIDKLSETELVASADLDIAFSRVLRNARRAPDMDARHANQSRKSRICRERVRTCAGLATLRKCRKALSQQAASVLFRKYVEEKAPWMSLRDKARRRRRTENTARRRNVGSQA